MTSLNPSAGTAPVSRAEVGTWAVLVALTQYFTFLGVPLALVLAFTRLRSSAPVARWGLVGVAAAIIVVQILGLTSGGATGNVGPEYPVN